MQEKQDKVLLYKEIDCYISQHFEQNESNEIRTTFYKIKSYLAPILEEDGALDTDFLDSALENIDNTFSECLLRMIDDRELQDVDVYKGANIDRKLFSKIRCNKDYHPQKETALAFCISLKLTFDETNKLLSTAGYVVSNSDKRDIVLRYFIEKGIYDLSLINETLYHYKQKLL